MQRIVRRNMAPTPGRYTCDVVLGFSDREELAQDIEVDIEPYYFSGVSAPKHAVAILYGIDPAQELKAVALSVDGQHLFGGDVMRYDVDPDSTKVELDGVNSKGRYGYP